MSGWLKNILIVFLLLALFWACGLLWFITLIPWGAADDKANTDAIVVLTGGGERLERGFTLLAEGRAPKMLISGVENGVTLAGLLRKKEFAGFATHIPPESVALGYMARSTVGNAEETAEWAAREHVRSIRLVTGNYHMPRSLSELHAAMPDVTLIPDPVFPGHFSGNTWWQFPGSLRLVLSEYHKYVTSLIVHTLLEQS